ncbi:MFS transporter [Pseudogemmobacter sp. W21_MBD1_M6]|uniref:MFS transporter n=1 Tax=Pseudogemmobacter sp. W21_MBD1_M6 TaxID=3240271 RepID=UPI003F9C0EF1
MSIKSAFVLSRAPIAAFAVVGIYWGAFAALVPQIKAGLGAGDAAFGAALLCSAVGLVTAMWLAPLIDERLGRFAMPAAALVLGLAFLVPGQVAGLVAFSLAMLGVGMGSGLTDVVMNARVSRIEARSGRSLMNLNHAMFSFAYAGAALATGLMREAGFPASTVFALLLPVTLLLCVAMQGKEDADLPQTAATDAPFPVRVVLWGGLITLVAFMSENATEGWSALHVERTLGGGAAEGALGPAMLGLTMGIGRFSGQIVAERLAEARVILWASLVSACGAVIAALAAVPMVAYVGFGVLGLGVSVIAPMALALVGRRVPAHARTKAISRTAVIGFLGFFIGPPVMGFISEGYGLRAAFGFVAALMAVVPVLVIALRWQEKKV